MQKLSKPGGSVTRRCRPGKGTQSEVLSGHGSVAVGSHLNTQLLLPARGPAGCAGVHVGVPCEGAGADSHSVLSVHSRVHRAGPPPLTQCGASGEHSDESRAGVSQRAPNLDEVVPADAPNHMGAAHAMSTASPMRQLLILVLHCVSSNHRTRLQVPTK